MASEAEKQAAAREAPDPAAPATPVVDRALLEDAAAGIGLCRNGTLLWVNAGAAVLTGRTRDELVGTDPLALLHPDDRRPFEKYRAGALPVAGDVSRYEARLFPRNGESRWIEVAMSAVELDDGPAVLLTAFDVTLRKLDEESLVRQKELLQAILDSISEGIIVTDAHRNVAFINPAAERMIGKGLHGGKMPASKGVYRPDMVTPYDESELPLARAIRGETVQELEMFVSGNTGEDLWLLASGAPLRHSDQAISGGVLILRDLTEHRMVERMKSEFLAVVSHELRTPLTAIRGALALLAHGALGNLPEDDREILEIAQVNTERLIRIVNDILDMQTMESGQFRLSLQECNAADLMAQAAGAQGGMAARAGITLSVAPVSAALWADPHRLLQVLGNLINNAIKFSPPDTTVTLTADVRANEVVFRVTDQGRGIPADKLEVIFERFQQVEPSLRREKGGTGLGLAICKSIIQQHGGRIWAESQPGAGSRFCFALPLHGGLPPQ